MAADLLDLSGRIALVTGAGQGVGRRIATLLAEHGATVVANDYYLDRAQAAAAEIEAAGGRALAVAADVSDYASVKSMVDEAERAFGVVNILVNNAGNIGATAQIDHSRPPFWETDPASWAPWFGVNAFGPMNCAHAVLPKMVEARDGRIITISSDSGRVGNDGFDAYSASKAAAMGFTRSLARSIGKTGTTVNAVALGTIDTESAQALITDPEYMERRLRHFVIPRTGRVDDAAAMTLFLASPAAAWITGQTIPVNGGFSFNL